MTEPAWQPTATIEAIARRAELYADIRAYFSAQDVLEVEVPVLGEYGVTDVHIDNPQGVVGGRKVYLQSSPEYFLKRLLAAYGRAVYSLEKPFARAREAYGTIANSLCSNGIVRPGTSIS